MATKDLHEIPFDECTVAKLEIFEDYAEAWIPTFVMQGKPEICIFDFFAGTGYDKNGVPGSPIRLLRKIKQHLPNILDKKVKIHLYLNEFEPNKKVQKKFNQLKESCGEFLKSNKEIEDVLSIHYFNKDFETIFPLLLHHIKVYPSLVYLDQNGVKFLAHRYFLELEKTKQTDFLYFVSASYFWRFGDTQEFKMHIDIDMAEAKKDPYKLIHRNLINQLKKKLPLHTKVKLYPYSLKKGANIHGIIFGASHQLAVAKFLGIAWRRNELNGEANFDIDDDNKKDQLDLFENNKLKKLDNFKENVRKKVLAKELTNNVEVFNFALNEGHIGTHAADCLKAMKRKGEISYNGTSPLVTYEKVHKEKKVIGYTIVGE